MKQEFFPAESHNERPVSLRSIHEDMGLTRFDVRELIEEFRRDPDAKVDASQKSINTALEALHIEDIWNGVREWIDAHPDSKGLSETNVPALGPLMEHPCEANHKIPRASSEIEIDPLSRDSYLELGQVFTPEEQVGRPHIAEGFTRDLLQAQLVLWEVRMQESLIQRTGSKTLRQLLYERYLSEIMLQNQSYLMYKMPATRKMYAGFSFGQSVYWRLPDEAHKKLIPKLGMTHLVVIKEMSEQTDAFREMKIVEGGIEPGFLDKIKDRESAIHEGRKQRLEYFGASFEEITTGCPAFFTPAFEEVGAWIRDIRSDLDQSASTE